MTKFKIVSCSNSILWYNQYVGEEFEAVKETETSYWTLEPDNRFRLINWVYKKDTERVQ